MSTIDDPPGGTLTVCTKRPGGLTTSPSRNTFRKTLPITWNELVKLGPAFPKKIRTLSPTLALRGLSLVRADSLPLNTTMFGSSRSPLGYENSTVDDCLPSSSTSNNTKKNTHNNTKYSRSTG